MRFSRGPDSPSTFHKVMDALACGFLLLSLLLGMAGGYPHAASALTAVILAWMSAHRWRALCRRVQWRLDSVMPASDMGRMRRYLRIHGYLEQALPGPCFFYTRGRLAGWLRMSPVQLRVVDAAVEVTGSAAVVDALHKHLSSRWKH